MKTWLLGMVAMVMGAVGLLAGMGMSLAVEHAGRSAVHASASVPVDGVQLPDTPEPEVVDVVADAKAYAARQRVTLDTAQLVLRSANHARNSKVALVCGSLRLSWAAPSARWRVDGCLTAERAGPAPVVVYAHLDAAGVAVVDRVVVSAAYKGAKLPENLPLGQSPLEPAPIDAQNAQLVGVARAVEQIAQLYGTQLQQVGRKRSTIELPDVDSRDVAFAAEMFGR